MIQNIMFVLIAHMTGDYLFQSNYLAVNKGKDNYLLLAHSVLYMFGIMIVAFVMGIELNLTILALIGVIHFEVDYLKARGITTKWLGDKKALILDQVIHYVTLLALLY